MRNSEPMSTAGLLKYMQTCYSHAVCNVVLIDLIDGITIFELQWAVGEKIIAKTFTEGHLYRDNKRLQKEFNQVRAILGAVFIN